MSENKISIKDSLTIDIVKENSTLAVLSLNGSIDTYNSEDFQKEINKLIDEGFMQLVFNLNQLGYISSTGIGSFTAFLKAVRPKGGDLVLSDVQDQVFDVFKTLGFSNFFKFTPNLEEAKRIVSGQTTNSSVFPVVLNCLVCSKTFKVSKTGRFKCSQCNSYFNVDEKANIILS